MAQRRVGRCTHRAAIAGRARIDVTVRFVAAGAPCSSAAVPPVLAAGAQVNGVCALGMRGCRQFRRSSPDER